MVAPTVGGGVCATHLTQGGALIVGRGRAAMSRSDYDPSDVRTAYAVGVTQKMPSSTAGDQRSPLRSVREFVPRTAHTAALKPTVGTGVLDCPNYVSTNILYRTNSSAALQLSLLLWEKGDHEVGDEESLTQSFFCTDKENPIRGFSS